MAGLPLWEGVAGFSCQPGATCFCFADLTFLWPLAVWAGGPLWAWGEGVVSGFAGLRMGEGVGGGGGCSVESVVDAASWLVLCGLEG